MPDLLTVREAAEALRLSPATVRARCRDGTIRAARIGRAANAPLRVPRAELDRLLDLEPQEQED
jgi:excisionase family DNA binding protein